MRPATVVVGLAVVVAAEAGAQYNIIKDWPRKITVTDLRIDSSPPDLLPPDCRTCDLHVDGERGAAILNLRCSPGKHVNLSAEGCDGVTRPEWSRRATARRLPPAPGSSERRVEIRLTASNSKSCALVGILPVTTGAAPGREVEPVARPDDRAVPEDVRRAYGDFWRSLPAKDAGALERRLGTLQTRRARGEGVETELAALRRDYPQFFQLSQRLDRSLSARGGAQAAPGSDIDVCWIDSKGRKRCLSDLVSR